MYSGTNWAYVLGVFLGDGCVYGQWSEKNQKAYPCFAMTAKDKDFIEAVQRALQSLTRYAVSFNDYQDGRFTNCPRTYRLRCGDPRLCAALLAETSSKQKLPEWIFDAPPPDRLALIAGLMDSEGYVCVKDGRQGATLGFKSTDVWFDDYLRLLRSVGIQHGKIGVERPRKPGYRTPRRISIKLRSWIDAGAYFNIGRKRERVERWAAMPYVRPPRAAA